MTKSKKKKRRKFDDDEEIIFGEEEDELYEQANLPADITDVDGIELPLAWGQTATNIAEVQRHRKAMNLKHGMMANVPMVCKGAECPMNSVCTIPIRQRPIFNRCPIEIASIIELYDRYCEQHSVGDEDWFDQSQIKDLVDTEIKLMRANGHLATSADFIVQVVSAVDDKGKAHYKPELHKATDYEDQLIARKYKILSELKATRKAKKDDNNVGDPSSFAAELMRKAMKVQKNIIIDAEVEETTDDKVEEPTQAMNVGELLNSIGSIEEGED